MQDLTMLFEGNIPQQTNVNVHTPHRQQLAIKNSENKDQNPDICRTGVP